MAWVVTAVVGSSLIGGFMSSNAQSDAASSAANAQGQASASSIAEQRRQFDAIQKLLSPYIKAGGAGLAGQLGLVGLAGDDAQQQAIASIADSPQMQALTAQGENAILQNSAATGGVRGGNTQGALAQFRPAMLSQLIESQYSKLGGLAGMGQASAAGQASAGQTMANNISNLLQQQGSAQAGNYLAQGQAQANMWGNLSGAAGTLIGYKGGF
jgi:hypothetical protein